MLPPEVTMFWLDECVEFEAFPKIPRLTRECVITEKIDGTNAQILIEEPAPGTFAVRVGSRNRWITIDDDNFGFAAWVQLNLGKLIYGLGVGRHYGEWWGHGIQRGYGLTEKRFTLFNTARWKDQRDSFPLAEGQQLAPWCCHVSKPLYIGEFDTDVVDGVLDSLKTYGSRAAPGYMNPEGVVVFHTAANAMFKKTIHKDEARKGA